MEVKEMSKAQLLDVMKAAGDMRVFSHNERWKHAFELARKAGVIGFIDMYCNSCRKKVHAWMQREV